MLLSHKTSIKLNNSYSNIVGHMCYAAYKLWNVCNYERVHYKEFTFPEGVTYPDWYYQKSYHKSNLWYKQLPSQSAQEVCKLLDKSWKSFYKLQKTGGVKNPNPPRYKHEPMVVTYMQKAIVHKKNSDSIRLTVSKTLKEYMASVYDIHEDYLYLKNQLFKNMNCIKQIKIYPPKNNKSDIIIIYEIEDVIPLEDNGKYLSIDFGLHNLFTCFDSTDGNSFIVGRKYLSICNYYSKEIARVQKQWYKQQSRKGNKHFKGSKHITKLYCDRNNSVHDYLHKVTRCVVNYCKKRDIHTVIVGDIKGIRKGKNYTAKTNQKLHALPYDKLYIMLEYKLALEGIVFIKQNEAYSSQCSPLSNSVDKTCAQKNNRKNRGLYRDKDYIWNADVVGAYNILRLFLNNIGKTISIAPIKIKNPYIVKVAV